MMTSYPYEDELFDPKTVFADADAADVRVVFPRLVAQGPAKPEAVAS